MAGFIGLYNNIEENKILDNMLDVIKHRGPDYRLKYEDDIFKLGYVGLDTGYVFDKKELFEDDDILVLLNGYISNYDELIEYINTKDVTVNDLNPSKVISIIYKRDGMKIAELLKGSYVVFFYDKKSKILTVLRDRFATQPIYYYQTETGLILASESKALLEHPGFTKEFNEKALVPYLVFQASPLTETFFKGVYSLPPASYLVYEDSKIDIQIYWDVDFEPKAISLDEASNKINEIIGNSIENKTKYFKNKDEIGTSLSGGVDSSYLASRYRPKKTFTVGYDDEEFSEIGNAKALSEIIAAENISEVIDAQKSFEKLEEIAYMCDEPFANLSAVPMYFLSNKISQYVKVVLTGEGSDEIFGGYYEYTEPSHMDKYKKLPLGIRKFFGHKMLHTQKDFKGKNFMIKGLPVEEWFIGQAKIFHENEALGLVKKDYRNSIAISELLKPYFDKVKDKSDLIKKQYLDFHFWMVNDIALKADRMNIGNSVQIITPILDEDLVEFARTLPDDLKLSGNKVKIAFRNAALKYLPEDWSKRKKLGYVVPVRKWMHEEEFSKKIFAKLTGETAQKFFNIDMINQLIEENTSGKRAQHRKLWTIYMFILWYDEYFIKR